MFLDVPPPNIKIELKMESRIILSGNYDTCVCVCVCVCVQQKDHTEYTL